MKTESIHIRVTENAKWGLETAALEERRTLSGLLHNIISDYLLDRYQDKTSFENPKHHPLARSGYEI